MTVASCPSCREHVTVPVDATPECIVRCPLCHEEFRLEAFLSQLPPALIVLGKETATADQGTGEESSLWDDSASHVLTSLDTAPAPGETDDAVPAFDFTPESPGDSHQEGTVGVLRRAGRRQKNSTFEVLKIVAGGLLAIPAAQLILWWFVPGDWKRDLLGIGPAVSRVVPWIVPQKFRAQQDLLTPEPRFAPESDSRRTVLERRRARQRQNNGSALPLPASGTTAPLPDIDARQLASEAQPDDSPATTDAPTDSSGLEPRVENAPTATDTEAPAGTSVVQQYVQGVRGAPQSSLSDLRAAFESALQTSIVWDTSPDQSEARRTELNDQFYAACAKLGESITYMIPTGDPAERDLVTAIQDVLGTFAQQPKKLALIGNRSAQWLDQVDRPTQGVFLFGTVKQIQPAGQVFETALELASLKQRTVIVVSRLDPRPFYASGDRVLMLGTIVLDPARNLLGYDGKEPMVVMGGLPTVLKP